MSTREIVLVGVIAASAIVLVILIGKMKRSGKNRAPQTPIQTPQDQSDFITSSSGSEIG